MTPAPAYQIVRIAPPGFPFVQAFSEVVETVQAGLQMLGHAAPVHVNEIEPGLTPILFGAHHLDAAGIARLPPDSILYNLEQLLPGYPWFTPDYLTLLGRFRVLDYQPGNLRFLRDNGIAGKAALLPVGYHAGLTRIAPAMEEDIDALFIGIGSPHRQRVLERLQAQGIRVTHASNVWGTARDALLARARLVLNIPLQPGGLFEDPRVLYAMANRKTVLCITDEPAQVPADLAPGLVLSTAEHAAASAHGILRHTGFRRNLGELAWRLVSTRRRIDALLQDAGFAAVHAAFSEPAGGA